MSWHYVYNSLWKVLVPDELRAAEWAEIIQKQKSHRLRCSDSGTELSIKCLQLLPGV